MMIGVLLKIGESIIPTVQRRAGAKSAIYAGTLDGAVETPSLRDANDSFRTESLPLFSCSMNPKLLASLNHFTVPRAIGFPPFLRKYDPEMTGIARRSHQGSRAQKIRSAKFSPIC